MKNDETQGRERLTAQALALLRNLTRHSGLQLAEVLNLSSTGVLLALKEMIAELGDAVEFQTSVMTFLGEVVHFDDTETGHFVGIQFQHRINENHLRNSLSEYFGID